MDNERQFVIGWLPGPFTKTGPGLAREFGARRLLPRPMDKGAVGQSRVLQGAVEPKGRSWSP